MMIFGARGFLQNLMGPQGTKKGPFGTFCGVTFVTKTVNKLLSETPLAATLHMLLSGEILTLEGPSSLLRVRFELIKHDIMSMCGHGTCVNIVVSAFARFFIVLFSSF